MQLDRFTFHNNTSCFVELENEVQVSKALQSLDKLKFMRKTIFARPMREDFIWGRTPRQSEEQQINGRNRYFYAEGSGPSDALRALREGRRMMLSVQTPGWGTQDMIVSTRNKHSLAIIEQYLGKYDIEAIGNLSPFYGDKKDHPRMLCFMDFRTKAGANQAVVDLQDTEIEDRRVLLRPSSPSPWRSHQIGKVDKTLLEELQAMGLASMETYDDKFNTPLTPLQVPKKKKNSKSRTRKGD